MWISYSSHALFTPSFMEWILKNLRNRCMGAGIRGLLIQNPTPKRAGFCQNYTLEN